MPSSFSSELGGLSARLESVWADRPLPKREWRLPLHPQPTFRVPDTADMLPELADPASCSVTHPLQGMAVEQSSDQAHLLARGKGKHTCPHGAACDKGGCDDDGSLVIFERNSAFR